MQYLYDLLEIFPTEIKDQIPLENYEELIEIVLDFGRHPELRFNNYILPITSVEVTLDHINYCISKLGPFSGDDRAGLERSLHRISAIRNRFGKIIGLTCRIGKAVSGTIEMIKPQINAGKSVLLLGRPGVGKTTALREVANVLSQSKRVIIIDTSNEIAGDGDIPHSAIGNARRMQVPSPDKQHHVMIAAVENHTPQVLILDEIGTEMEARAARAIAERGVMIIATAHGNTLENLIKNPPLSDLVGGVANVILSDDEAKRRNCQKAIQERKAHPTFDVIVEMHERDLWLVHNDVSAAVDKILRGVKITENPRSTHHDQSFRKTRKRFR